MIVNQKNKKEIITLKIPGYENVLEIKNPETGLHAFIAIHNTTLGPALGGLRIFPYKTREEALEDALRLAKGMTYKSAAVEIGLGGGKSVIIANPKTDKTPALLKAFAEALDTLKGKYIVAEDVGSAPEDMLVIRETTPYVAALPTDASSGDPSRFTAWGVFRGMEAVAHQLWGSRSLKEKTVLIQGVGNVGACLAELLFWRGANLLITDIDEERTRLIAKKVGGRIVDPDAFCKEKFDIYAPCALGGTLNERSIPQLSCVGVAGSANNQLLTPEDGERLTAHDILYAPDYLINAGGIINAAMEFSPEGYDPNNARNQVDKIYNTLLEVFRKAEQQHLPTGVIADKMAEEKIEKKIGKRKNRIEFTQS